MNTELTVMSELKIANGSDITNFGVRFSQNNNQNYYYELRFMRILRFQ